jgi:hypothetical protein
MAHHAAMGKRPRKGSGHWCWCCGRHRPNERFSGRGHRRHLCKDCSKLGKQELAYRQAVIDIDRLAPKNLAGIERIATTHPDARVQKYARECVELIEAERQMLREARRRDEELLEAFAAGLHEFTDGPLDENVWGEDDEIPF